MATARQLKALIKSYADGDDSLFLSVATQIAASASRAGKNKLAHELRELVENAKRTPPEGNRSPVPLAQPRGVLSGLVRATYPKLRFVDMVLDIAMRARLGRVVAEHRQRVLLQEHGLSPRRKLLLVGPPGCGKSMTAAAIAGELGLPLLTVQFHTLITKFMGETSAKLNLIFEEMSRTRGVYLFDELDSIGGHRSRSDDVGEIKRVLNSFLIFLEGDQTESLVIAATNLVESLDEALFRRFDDVIFYEPPTKSMVRDLIASSLSAFELRRLSWNKVLEAADGLSHSDVVRACEDAAKDAVLESRETVLSSDLVKALSQRANVGLSRR